MDFEGVRNCRDNFHLLLGICWAQADWFLHDECGVGLGSIALGQILGGAGSAADSAVASTNPLAVKQPHFTGKAKRVIFLFMAGAPSHLELFDNKPQLAKFDGTLPPPELLKGYRAAFINPNSKLLGPQFKFAKYGQSETELSEPGCRSCWKSSTTSPL